MACTNRGGWPGCRWGRGPDWTTTGVIRPVTEIQSSVSVAVDYLARYRAEQVFVDAALALQPARCAVGAGAAVVDLAGGKPAVRHHASRCSTPKRASRSRCFTTITLASGSDKMRRSLGRLPFRPEPTSHTTCPTPKSRSVAHAVRRATCRSRSERLSWLDTRAYSTTPAAAADAEAAVLTRINRPTRSAGTGNVPSRNQR